MALRLENLVCRAREGRGEDPVALPGAEQHRTHLRVTEPSCVSPIPRLQHREVPGGAREGLLLGLVGRRRWQG